MDPSYDDETSRTSVATDLYSETDRRQETNDEIHRLRSELNQTKKLNEQLQSVINDPDALILAERLIELNERYRELLEENGELQNSLARLNRQKNEEISLISRQKENLQVDYDNLRDEYASLDSKFRSLHLSNVEKSGAEPSTSHFERKIDSEELLRIIKTDSKIRNEIAKHFSVTTQHSLTEEIYEEVSRVDGATRRFVDEIDNDADSSATSGSRATSPPIITVDVEAHINMPPYDGDEARYLTKTAADNLQIYAGNLNSIRTSLNDLFKRLKVTAAFIVTLAESTNLDDTQVHRLNEMIQNLDMSLHETDFEQILASSDELVENLNVVRDKMNHSLAAIDRNLTPRPDAGDVAERAQLQERIDVLTRERVQLSGDLSHKVAELADCRSQLNQKFELCQQQQVQLNNMQKINGDLYAEKDTLQIELEELNRISTELKNELEERSRALHEMAAYLREMGGTESEYAKRLEDVEHMIWQICTKLSPSCVPTRDDPLEVKIRKIGEYITSLIHTVAESKEIQQRVHQCNIAFYDKLRSAAIKKGLPFPPLP